MKLFKKDGSLTKKAEDVMIGHLEYKMLGFMREEARKVLSDVSMEGLPTFPKILEEVHRLKDVVMQNSIANETIYDSLTDQIHKLANNK